LTDILNLNEPALIFLEMRYLNTAGRSTPLSLSSRMTNNIEMPSLKRHSSKIRQEVAASAAAVVVSVIIYLAIAVNYREPSRSAA